jgi:hypothetical protein
LALGTKGLGLPFALANKSSAWLVIVAVVVEGWLDEIEE